MFTIPRFRSFFNLLILIKSTQITFIFMQNQFQLKLLCLVAALSAVYADISLLSEGNAIGDHNGYAYPKPAIPFELPSVS